MSRRRSRRAYVGGNHGGPRDTQQFADRKVYDGLLAVYVDAYIASHKLTKCNKPIPKDRDIEAGAPKTIQGLVRKLHVVMGDVRTGVMCWNFDRYLLQEEYKSLRKQMGNWWD